MKLTSPLAVALSLSALQAPVFGQGGTVISEPPFAGFSAYPGGYGDEIAVLDDGTGHYDLLVAEPSNWERVHLLEGLTSESLAVILNPNPFGTGSHGYDITGIPDLTGDGVEDFAIGAPVNSSGGEVFIYRRKLSGLQKLRTTIPSPGPNTWNFGFALAGMEDVDGDGFGDLLIGAPGFDYGWLAYPGYAYLYSGATGAMIYRFSFSGANQSPAGFGKSVAAVPDLDGDGLEDIAVGGGSDLQGPGTDGLVFIYSSATGALIQEIDSPYNGGDETWARQIAGVEDLNGDGRGDVLVGAPGSNRALLYSAYDGVLLDTLAPPIGQASMDFGWAVDGSADVDGDGVHDLLVGAPREKYQSPFRKGRAYLYSGATGGLLRAYHTPEDYLPGFDEDEFFGVSVVISPDSNGDGLADVIVGASTLDIPETADGATFSFFCLVEEQANIAIRLGTPPNPEALIAESEPLIGGDFVAAIDHAGFVPASQLDLGLFSTGPANLSLPGGTLLVDLGALLFTKLAIAGTGPISVGIPSDSALVGAQVSVQGASWDGVQLIGTNALDLTIGSY